MSEQCNCIDAINATLAQANGKLGLTFALSNPGGAWPTIEVQKIKPRGERPPAVIPTYCPFCGTKYRAGEREAEKAEREHLEAAE